MANLLDLRNKINSTKNTGQITKALQMVSAARQKKAQDFLNNSRFLRIGIREMMGEVQKIQNTDSESGKLSPWFSSNKSSDKALIISIMSQRGLCGSMNSSLFFEILKFKKNLGKNVEFISVNKVAQKYLKNFEEPIISYFTDIKENPDLDYVLPISDFVKDRFSEYESVYIAYTNFIKSGIFEPKIVKLLPIEQAIGDGKTENKIDYSVEPDPYTLLNSLANLFIDFEIYEAILSNQAAEHSARMIAMKKATDNVKEIVKDLTLTMNKARQAKITQAVAEISANL
jgi:F-type H+-transporting ATPase subunit gamma